MRPRVARVATSVPAIGFSGFDSRLNRWVKSSGRPLIGPLRPVDKSPRLGYWVPRKNRTCAFCLFCATVLIHRVMHRVIQRVVHRSKNRGSLVRCSNVDNVGITASSENGYGKMDGDRFSLQEMNR